MKLNIYNENNIIDRYHDAEINIFSTLGGYLLFMVKQFIPDFRDKFKNEFIDKELEKFETDQTYNKIKEYIGITGDWMKGTMNFIRSSDGIDMTNEILSDFNINFKVDYNYIKKFRFERTWLKN